MEDSIVLLNLIVILVSLHITVSSVVWIIKHNRNGWAYGILPFVVGINVLAFSVTVTIGRIFSLGIDNIFLAYWSQTVRILSLTCFAIAIRIHLRYIKRLNLMGDYK